MARALERAIQESLEEERKLRESERKGGTSDQRELVLAMKRLGLQEAKQIVLMAASEWHGKKLKLLEDKEKE